MFVGEAPGYDEDLQGEPFVGASGKLLDKMLRSVGIIREECIISNTIRCRPPGNRTPESEEIQACKPWLWKELMIVKPKVLVPLGKTPSRLLLRRGHAFSVGSVVGKFHEMDYLPDGVVVPMYHPSYLLRQGEAEVKKMVKVLKKIKDYIEENP